MCGDSTVFFGGFLAKHAGGIHDAGLVGVIAVCDSRYDNVAVLQREVLIVPFDGDTAESGIERLGRGCWMSGRHWLDLVAAFAFPASFGRAVVAVPLAVSGIQSLAPSGLHVRERYAILRPLGSGKARL